MSMTNGRAARAIACLLVGAAAAWAQDGLDAQQQARLKAAVGQLGQAQTNLKAAQDSAGPANQKPSASRAKLALTRAASARANANAGVEVIKDLPADHADVAATRQQLDAVLADITALETRLTGGSAGGATSGAGTGGGGTKLDYKQEEQLKNARFYLREVEGYAGGLEDVVAKVGAAENPDLVDHRLLAQAAATIEKARQRVGYIADALKPLPADGAGVKEAADGAAAAVAHIDKAQKTLMPVHQRLQKIVDPASYPNLDTDVKRMQELANMYGSPEWLTHDPLRAVEVIKQASAARSEYDRVVKTYALLVAQQTEAGERVKGSSAYFAQRFQAFAAAANEAKQTLPAQVQADLDQTARLADQAAQEQKPMFFTGGIPQQLGFAQDKLALLAVLDAPAAAGLQQKMDQLKADLKQKQAALREQIIAANELPPDRYNGPDKEALAQKAISTWTALAPKAKVLGVRFPSEAWRREVTWRLYDATWSRSDRSRLQAQLLVQENDRIAAIQPINLYMDHMAGDTITGVPLFDVNEELQPQSYLLIAKIK